MINRTFFTAENRIVPNSPPLHLRVFCCSFDALLEMIIAQHVRDAGIWYRKKQYKNAESGILCQILE